MKKLLWFVLGIGAGLVAAHFMNRDPRGHALLSELDARITEFTDRIGDAYRAEDARLADGGVPAASASSTAAEADAPETPVEPASAD